MKAAPIHLQQVSFRQVSVAVNEAALAGDDSEQVSQNLAFDHCKMGTQVRFSPLEQADTTQQAFLLTLRVVLDNKATDDEEESDLPPYLVDIEAGGIIALSDGAEALDDIEDIVLVNGTSMLWGAIREQICSLTARMPLGMATLPTVHFQDLRGQWSKNESAPAESEGSSDG